MPRKTFAAAPFLLAPLALSGCIAATIDPSAADAVTIEEACAQPHVLSCEPRAASGITSSATISADASAAETRDLVRMFQSATGTAAAEGLSVSRETDASANIIEDTTAPARWTLPLSGAGASDAEGRENELSFYLSVEDVPGVLSSFMSSGWPSVTIDSLDGFEAAFETVSALPSFTDGGTYTLYDIDKRLQIVDAPTWTNRAIVPALVEIASDYPDAEILWQAEEGGRTPPTLYISKLTPEGVADVQNRLGDPALSSPSADGVQIAEVLGSLGADGTTYATGVVGQLP